MKSLKAQTQDDERERRVKEVLSYIREHVSERYFGKITLTFKEGHIVHAEEYRSRQF